MTRNRGMTAGSPRGPVMLDLVPGFRRPSRTRGRGCLMSLRTLHRLFLIVGAASVLALLPAAASAATAADGPGPYSTIDVPGAADTLLTVINDLGIAVGYYIDSSGVAHGFIDHHGSFTTINAPGAGTAAGQGTFVANMNNLGVIAGFTIDSNGVQHGFIDSGGRFTTINDPNAGTAGGQG